MLTQRRIAYHEAGHAAGFLIHGTKFKYVTSIPASDGSFAGCVKVLEGSQSRGDFDFVCVTAGGIIADRLSRGRGDFTINTMRAWKQYGWLEPDIRILLDEFPDRRQLLDLVVHAASLITAYWPGVEAVAQALMEPRELGYVDTAAIFGGALPVRHTSQEA